MYIQKVTYNSLFENVQQAKDLLFKNFAKNNRMDVKTLDDQVKKEILTDPNWIEIRDLNAKTPNYTYLFTKFFFEENATMDMIKSIHEKILRYKQNLNELPMPVDQYAKIEKTKEDSRPGWERLSDDLDGIERGRALKELYNEFNSNMKDQFKKASPDDLRELTDIANKVKSKGPDAWEQFLGFDPETKKYTNIKRYDDLDKFIEFSRDFIKNYGLNVGEIIRKIEAIGLSAKALYSGGNYVAVSIRTPEGQKELFGDLPWCITAHDSQFWNYSENRIQLNIFNFNLPQTDKMYAIGLTIEKNGKIYTDADKYNNRLPGGGTGKNFVTFLRDLGYPAAMCDTLEKDFPDEVLVKTALEAFQRFAKDGKINIREIVTSLVGVNRNIASGLMSKEQWQSISGEVSRIIYDQLELKDKDFMDFFKDNGIYTIAMWNVFDEIVGNKYTAEDMQALLASTEEGISEISTVVKLAEKGKGFKAGKEEIENLKNIVKEKDDILKRITSRIK